MLEDLSGLFQWALQRLLFIALRLWCAAWDWLMQDARERASW